MIFPFVKNETAENGGLIGQTFVAYLNTQWFNDYESFGEVTFMEEGKTAEGWEWRVEGGILEILDDAEVVVQRYNGVEIVNGVVLASGTHIAEGNLRRVVLCPKKGLGDTNWNIFVSDAPAHNDDVAKKLIKSFKRAKVDLSKVTMVTGGIPVEKGFSVSRAGVRRISHVQNIGGGTALGPYCDGDYRILLHGTCTVAEDFPARMAAIDVSLNPDIVFFRPGWEMGVYAERFLREQTDLDAFDSETRAKILRSRANVVVSLGGRTEEGAASDTYDNGTLRTELSVPKCGITKYKSAQKR